MTVNIIEGKNYEDRRTCPNDAHRSAVGEVVGTYAGSGRIPSNIYTVLSPSLFIFPGLICVHTLFSLDNKDGIYFPREAYLFR